MAADTVETLLRRADESYSKARFDEAEALYREILQEEPGNAPALNRLGAIAAQRGEWIQAEHYFQGALGVEPKFAQAHMNIGNLYFERGEYQQALEKYLEAEQIQPELPAIHNNLGAVYKKLGKIELSVQHRRKAQKLERTVQQQEAKVATQSAGKELKRRFGCLPTMILLVLVSLGLAIIL